MTAEGDAGVTSDDVQGPNRKLQVVSLAASAGGLHALRTILTDLPATFPAALVVVQHMDRHHRSLLPQILRKQSRIKIEQAEDGAVLEPGKAYIAAPDRHLLVNADGTLSLTQSEPVHYLRPSADLLFRSVAAACGERAIAVVLTGTGRDGSEGVCAIKERGGTVIVEDRDTAEYAGMPTSAILTGCTDLELRLEEIAEALIDLVEGRESR